MQGRKILAKDYKPRAYAFAARDRCGEVTDRIRSVRSERYLYIRNFHPRRPLLQPSQYKDNKLILQRLRELYVNGSLGEVSERLLFAPERPAEELYIYAEDPWQNQNLAQDSAHQEALEELRNELDRWIEATGDLGSESPEVYAQEVEDELSGTKPTSERYKTFRKNADLYMQWAEEGR